MEQVSEIKILEPNSSSSLSRTRDQVFQNVDDLIRSGIDACVIATPTNTHAEIAVLLGEARIPTLIEKPISNTIAAAIEIQNTFTRNETIGAIGHIERFNPAMINLKARILSGEVGEVIQYATFRQSPFPVRVSDVGVVTDLGSHDIHSLLWISQSTYKTQASTCMDTNNDGREDVFFGTGFMVDGTAYCHTVNWVSPFKERKFSVTGTDGTLVADTLSGDLVLYKNGTSQNDWETVANFRGMSEGDVIRFSYPKREPLFSELNGFFAAIDSGDMSGIVTLSEGISVLSTVQTFLTQGKSQS
jgi:predicted dehydrogenase